MQKAHDQARKDNRGFTASEQRAWEGLTVIASAAADAKVSIPSNVLPPENRRVWTTGMRVQLIHWLGVLKMAKRFEFTDPDKKLVLITARVETVVMNSNTAVLGRVVSDPVVSWRAGNAQVTESEPTFDAVTPTATSLSCIVRVSRELAEDSINIEAMLEQVLVKGLSEQIEKAGLFW